MSNQKKETEDPHKLLKYVISAFVSVTHVIAFFQIVICSRHLAVAFNIPPKNIGIYFPKLYSLRSVLMSMACGIEYLIYRIVQIFCSNMAIDIRKYLSMAWFVLLTVCEISFLCVLYFSKSVAFHNYIVLNLEGMFFGFFQMSILSLIPEFVPYYMLSLYVSGTSIFIIQTIIDRCTKNSMLSVKIQAWICVICSVICVGIWPVRLFVLKDTTQTQTTGTSSTTCSTEASASPIQAQQPTAPAATTTTGSSVSTGTGVGGAAVSGAGTTPGASNGATGVRDSGSSGSNGGSGGGSGSPGSSTTESSAPGGAPGASAPSSPEMEYVMSLTSISILKIMTTKLDDLSAQLSSEAIINVQTLIGRLQQITQESQITYDVLVAIDLVILSLKKCQCPESQLCLLAELSLFLRMKVLIKPLGEQKKEQTTIQELSYAYGGLGVQNYGKCSSGEPVVVEAARYTQLIKSVQTRSGSRSKRSLPEEHSRGRREAPLEQLSERPRSRRRRDASNQQQSGSGKKFHEHLFASLSQLLMFPIGSLVKDFLFPGVIPYGLLERDKCHLINLIVIIFLSVGPVVVFVLNQTIGDDFRKDNTYIHLCWTFMIPKIIILIISLCAIHTKQSCTHKIRSSQPVVLFMTVVVLTCYGFLETMSFVGMGHYVKIISSDPKPIDLLAIHNVFGKFFRYFVYKFSVGYNRTRISSGLVLPSFKPPEPIGDSFCYWFKGTFSNGWKDLKSDFKFNIKQYLAVGPTPSKKSPIETLRYCDIFM